MKTFEIFASKNEWLWFFFQFSFLFDIHSTQNSALCILLLIPPLHLTVIDRRVQEGAQRGASSGNQVAKWGEGTTPIEDTIDLSETLYLHISCSQTSHTSLSLEPAIYPSLAQGRRAGSERILLGMELVENTEISMHRNMEEIEERKGEG